MTYEAHKAFVNPARPKSEVWRLLVGIGFGVACYLALYALLFWVIRNVAPGLQEDLAGGATLGATPASMLALLYGFGVLGLAAMITARVIHRRPGGSVVGPVRPAVGDFFRSLRNLALLTIALLLIPSPEGEAPIVNLPFAVWLSLLPLSLTAILVQVASEEIVFRGYLQQQLAARFRSPIIWLAIPSLLFGAGHYAQADLGGNAIYASIWATVFGLAAGDLTARTGNLGAAIAFHFMNNMMAILIVTLPGPLSGLALYTYPFSASDVEALRPYLAIDLMFIFVAWLACRVAVKR